jgi:hypothetical protein
VSLCVCVHKDQSTIHVVKWDPPPCICKQQDTKTMFKNIAKKVRNRSPTLSRVLLLFKKPKPLRGQARLSANLNCASLQLPGLKMYHNHFESSRLHKKSAEGFLTTRRSFCSEVAVLPRDFSCKGSVLPRSGKQSASWEVRMAKSSWLWRGYGGFWSTLAPLTVNCCTPCWLPIDSSCMFCTQHPA